jgi:hypothetical protein
MRTAEAGCPKGCKGIPGDDGLAAFFDNYDGGHGYFLV